MQTMFALTEMKSKITESPEAVTLFTSPLDSSIVFDNVEFG